MIDTTTLPGHLRLRGYSITRRVYIDDKRLSEKLSQKVWNHSPDGFNWGYGGSGPAQLALAILLVFMPEQDAVDLHQKFKFKVIAALPQDKDFDWVIDLRGEIESLLEKKEQAK
jgi:hypothetical protein